MDAHAGIGNVGDEWSLLITKILIFFLSGSQQYPGESGDTHEWSGGCKGWKEGVRNCLITILYILVWVLLTLRV